MTVHETELPRLLDDGERILQNDKVCRQLIIFWIQTLMRNLINPQGGDGQRAAQKEAKKIDTDFSTLVITRGCRDDLLTCKFSCQLLELLLLISESCGPKIQSVSLFRICHRLIQGSNSLTLIKQKKKNMLEFYSTGLQASSFKYNSLKRVDWTQSLNSQRIRELFFLELKCMGTSFQDWLLKKGVHLQCVFLSNWPNE